MRVLSVIAAVPLVTAGCVSIDGPPSTEAPVSAATEAPTATERVGETTTPERTPSPMAFDGGTPCADGLGVGLWGGDEH